MNPAAHGAPRKFPGYDETRGSLRADLTLWAVSAADYTAADIPFLERVGSATKVDFVKPIQNGANQIVREFPATPLAHGFPDVIDNFAVGSRAFSLGDGATLYQLEGSLNGVPGRFEWIVDQGQVTHRMFVGGGSVNGIPIQP